METHLPVRDRLHKRKNSKQTSLEGEKHKKKQVLIRSQQYLGNKMIEILQVQKKKCFVQTFTFFEVSGGRYQ